ncbi:MAG: ATP-binding protein [Salinivirgaceae bacterium]
MLLHIGLNTLALSKSKYLEDLVKAKTAELQGKVSQINKLNTQLNGSNEELNATVEELNAINDELTDVNVAIGQERKQFLSVLDSIPEIIYVADIETHEILFANNKLKSIVGRDPTGEKCFEAIQNTKEVCSFCSNRFIEHTKEPYFWEHYNKLLQRYFYVMDRKIRWTDQKEVRFELAIDITKQKQFETDLRASEEKYRLITENASDVIWILNIDKGRFTYISPSVYTLRGYTQEEALAQSIEESLVPESIQKITSSMAEIIPAFKKAPDKFTNQIFIDELQQPCKDGSIIWIETSTRYQYNEDKEIEVIGISRNIDERKKHQEWVARRLRYEENLAHFSNTLFHNQPDVINKGLRYILQASQSSRVYIFENFIDKNNNLAFRQTHEICANGVPSELNNPLLQHLVYKKDGFERWQKELSENRTINGNVHEFPQSERVVLEPQGIKSILSIPIWVHQKWYGFIGFDDTKEEKNWTAEDVYLLQTASEILGLYIENQQNKNTIEQRNAALSEVNATKDKFFSIVSHDLRSPFSSILGLSELLKNAADELDREKIQRLASSIHDSGKSTFRLLENLLDWSRAQSGRIEFTPVDELLQFIVDEAISQLSRVAKAKQISLMAHIEEGIVVNADLNMLNAVFRNLISNSVKFTEVGGEVTVKATKKDNKVLVEVQDNGIGMPQITVDKLFQIEEKVSRMGTNNESGTGLGLLLCKEFVEKHGGHIWVESTEGQGSRFLFTLPLGEE